MPLIGITIDLIVLSFFSKSNANFFKNLVKSLNGIMLGYVSARKDCYATYCVENGSQVEHFTETCSRYLFLFFLDYFKQKYTTGYKK